MKYLDKDGLSHLWEKIKTKIPTKTSQLTNDSNYITNSGNTTGNSGSATKLQNARTIGIGTGATGTATSFNGTANITIPITEMKEAYMTWGGKSIPASVSPADMGCIDEFGHNKLAFLPAECIKVEYTTDGGTTWLDYGLTNAQKIAMVSTTGPTMAIGKGTVNAINGTLTNANCSNYKVRATISTRKAGVSSGSIYTQAKKWLLNITTNGASGVKVLIEDRTIANYNNNVDTWTTVGTYDVSGWSGWNSIPYAKTYGGGVNQTSQIADVRFTLSITSVNTSYNCTASFIDFRLIGVTNWTMPSEMARAGHLYTVDTDQNATFPANIIPKTNNSKTLGTSSLKWNNVYATTFTGNLTGTSSKATGDKNGDDITTTYYKASNPNGYTSNIGTITGITMNGSSKGTSGVVDLGTVITAHQDISGKQDKITSSNKLDYSLLSNTPTIPTVNNATLTIQKNGTNVQTFTANASSNKTANIIVPTKTSDITNDSGFLNSSGIVNLIYPVGSLYITTNSANPSTVFAGTTWEQIKDKFLLTAGDTYTAGSTGGASTIDLSHTHTSAKHNHGSGSLIASLNFEGGGVRYYYDNSTAPAYNYTERFSATEQGGSGTMYGGTRVIGSTAETTPNNTGSALSSSQSIMPPYLTVYVWKRIS